MSYHLKKITLANTEQQIKNMLAAAQTNVKVFCS